MSIAIVPVNDGDVTRCVVSTGLPFRYVAAPGEARPWTKDITKAFVMDQPTAYVISRLLRDHPPGE